MKKPQYSWKNIWFSIILLVMLWFIPISWIENGTCLCMIKRITGIECPGCGMIRAFFYFLHGEWHEAIALNWRCLVVIPMLIWLYWEKIIYPKKL